MDMFRRFCCFHFVFFVGMALIVIPTAQAWSKEGHKLTCQIAQSLLDEEAAEAVANLLPDHVDGDLSALCTWPDQIRYLYKYRWTSPLHFIDTPDGACTFDYERDCRDSHGVEDMCVTGAIQNFTLQLLHYHEGISDGRKNMTEALLFLSHFMGDAHQPMHTGFTSDLGGNTIQLRWYRRKSNLHHVWDRDILLQALKDYYNKDLDSLLDAITANITDGSWAADIPSWEKCDDLLPCLSQYAEESINLACKYGYKGINSGDTLTEEYFESRMPIVMKRIAQGGVRLAMILNSVFGDSGQGFAAAAAAAT